MYHLLIHNELGIQGGVLNRKGWIYVREQGDVRNNLIREMHGTPGGGHSGILATYQRKKRGTCIGLA